MHRLQLKFTVFKTL